MQTYLSIIRGINVSGKNPLKMEQLRALFEALQCRKVKTYIQSGNIVFQYKGGAAGHLQRQISGELEKLTGNNIPVLVLELEEWKAIAESNPFLKRKDTDPGKLHITFLAEAPAKTLAQQLGALSYPPDEIALTDKAVYLHCPDSYGNTKWSNQFLESKLKVSATTRNLKTVNELLRLAEEL